VQTQLPDSGRSAEEEMGDKLGAIRAAKSGRVIYVGNDNIRVQYDDGMWEFIPLSLEIVLFEDQF